MQEWFDVIQKQFIFKGKQFDFMLQMAACHRIKDFQRWMSPLTANRMVDKARSLLNSFIPDFMSSQQSQMPSPTAEDLNQNHNNRESVINEQRALADQICFGTAPWFWQKNLTNR